VEKSFPYYGKNPGAFSMPWKNPADIFHAMEKCFPQQGKPESIVIAITIHIAITILGPPGACGGNPDRASLRQDPRDGRHPAVLPG
jgi:hypothetical protein